MLVSHLQVSIIFLKLVAFLIPFQVFALPVLGEGIEASYIFASLVFVLLLGAFFLKGGRMRKFDTSERYLLLFFMVAVASFVIGVIFFRFEGQEVKGIKQLIGLFAMVLLFFAVHRCINRADEFIGIVRFLFYGMCCLAFLGLWQFLAFNFTNIRFLADWSWAEGLNPSIGGGWRIAGEMWGLYRAHSFAPEPAHYAMMLTSIIGLVFVRMFPLKGFRHAGWKSLLPSVPICISIFIGYILSFSILAMISIVIVVSAYYLLFSANKSIMAKVAVTILLFFLIFMVMDSVTEGGIIRKLATLKMIIPFVDKDITPEAISALALASNLEVGLKSLQTNPFTGWGVGGHPFAFVEHAPPWAALDPLIVTLNIEDAGSLTLRLISETGLIGFFLFLLFIYEIIYRALRAINKAKGNVLTPMCIGVLISTIGVVSMVMLRYGSYYPLVFWMSLGLTSTIPKVLQITSGKINKS